MWEIVVDGWFVVTDQERKWVLAVATRGDLEVSLLELF